MKVGTDLAQQINQLPEADKQALINGLGGSVLGMLASALLSKAMAWVADPANQATIINTFSGWLNSWLNKSTNNTTTGS